MPSSPESSSSPADHNFIRIPRWVIYFQVGLLCVVPTTCFLLGLAAAQLSRPASSTAKSEQLCELSGRLVTTDEAPLVGVVIALPLEQTPDERLDPRPLHPASFQELGNPAILSIQQLGGAVTRTGEAGTFRLQVASPKRYLLIAIAADSPPGRAEGQAGPDRATLVELSRWFLPLENLYRGQAIKTLPLQSQGGRLDLGEVNFAP